jgi:hypothetical protein
MSTEFDIRKVDRSNWSAIKFIDDSIYYGEVAYFDHEDTQVDEPDEEQQNPDQTTAQATIRKLRHGNGVQIFFRKDGSILSKYEGEWKKGEKSGKALILYPDSSEYIGNVKNGQKQANQGQYCWASGDYYSGHFKDNRMDGNGVFEAASGKKYDGVFRNNYFHLGGARYINPLHDEAQSQQILQYQDSSMKTKTSDAPQHQGIFETVKVYGMMREYIDKSNINYRIPLVVATVSTGLKIQMILDAFQSMRLPFTCFDLRKAYFCQKTNTIKEYLQEIKLNLAKAIVEGCYFWINIDDHYARYDEKFDPDFKEYYHRDYLPMHLFD